MKKKQPWILASFERVVLTLPKRNLRKQTARKLRVLESTLQTCATERARWEKQDLPDVAHLYSASQFCFICEADITVLLCEMMCADEEWSRVLFARHLALTVVEGAEDIPQVLGKQFRDALSKMVCDQAYLSRLIAITKRLSEFRRKHEKDLREIRNMVAAHRDLEARNQIQIIEKIDINRIKLLTTEFQDALLEFTKLMTEILVEFTLPNMMKGRVNFKLILERLGKGK
jgi:hypothetical protein